ncbi:hypothetical protein LTR17_001903 [Elasticomyces elasticus]|nr:hypothetical protein LTR17_001903 [Elasticomyces elasticus]
MEKPDITLNLSRPIISYDPNDYIEASVALFAGGYGVGDEYSLARTLAIQRDPDVCGVCTNLDWHVANALDGGNGPYIWVDPGRRAVRIVATLDDVSGEADKGCGSCLLIRECVVRLFDVDIDTECDTELEFVYRRNTTLTISWDSLKYNVELFTLKGKDITRSNPSSPECLKSMKSYRCTSIETNSMNTDQPSPWPTIGNEVVWTNPGGPSSSPFAWFGGSATLVQPDAASSACLHQIKTWMSQCEREHPYCQDRTRDPLKGNRDPPPKRLVSVGKSNEDLRLDEIDFADAPTYIALSYSWGKTKRLTCTVEKYDGLRDNIPHEKLAKTLQDAITITRGLGIPYIWIDGLCIKQGDAADWESESANMASIYGNAFLTITATGSSDCDDGCFGSRAQAVKVNITDVSGTPTTLYARKQIKHDIWDWRNNSAFEQSTRNSIKSDVAGKYPLFRRGWCFQERILSRRIIHYTAGELVWECLGMTSCECGTLDHFVWSTILQERRHAAGIPSDIEIVSNKLDRARAMENRMRISGWRYMIHNLPTFIQKDTALMHVAMGARARRVDAEIDRYHLRQRWYDLVRQYSQKSLTNDTDALPALTGLARCWADQGDLGGYQAGLWANDALAGLLWKCTDYYSENKRNSKYLAPSWSWASVRKAIDFVDEEKIRLYKVAILQISCQPASIKNTYGQVVSGILKLRGRPVEAIVRAVPDPAGTSHNFGLDMAAYGYNTTIPTTNGATFIPDCRSECLSLDGRLVYFLWYCTDVVNRETMQGYQRALILRKLDDGTYNRIGVRENCSETAWFGEHGDEPPEVEMTIV